MVLDIISEIWFPMLVMAGIWVYSKVAGEPEPDTTWTEIQKKVDEKTKKNLANSK